MIVIDGFTFCIAALLLCYFFGRKSLGHGASALLVVGYFYGILRANYLDGFSHFIFDMGLLGLYISQFTVPPNPRTDARSRSAKWWLLLLMAWPMFLFLLPINHYLIQLVGLRHIILFLPSMLLGARLRGRDLDLITNTLAVLNLIAFGFALLEYQSGLEPYFPRNYVTENMYRSHDVRTQEGSFFRIPSTFLSSHAYAGMMAATAVLFLNGILDERKTVNGRIWMAATLVISILGIFMAGPRAPIVQLGLVAAIILVLPGLKPSVRIALGACVLTIGMVCAYYIIDDPRMQRFKTLGDVEMVEKRATGSLSFSVTDTLLTYPLGVGLGGAAGASIPYFLKDYAPPQVGAENEYIRIAVEQGIIGFLLWILVIMKVVARKVAPVNSHWRVGTHAMKALVIVTWATAFVGTGMLQAIPNSFLLMLLMGVLMRVEPKESTVLQRIMKRYGADVPKPKERINPALNRISRRTQI
jgi:hypothetical protein